MSDDLHQVKVQWEQRIEHTLTRPLQYAANACALEAVISTAFSAWEMMEHAGEKPKTSTLTSVWRHVLKGESELRNQSYDPMMSAFHRIRDGYGDKLDIDDCIPFYRRIWDRIRNPIDRLAAIGEGQQTPG